MANTLSQYIGQIIDRRNQELQQRLAPLIPLLQADLAETKRMGEIERIKGDMQKYMTAAYGEEAGQAFSTGAADLTTAESLVSWQKTFERRQETAATAKEYISMLRARGVPISQEKEQQYMSIQDPAVLKTSITMDIDDAPMTDAAADGAALTNLRPAFKKKYDDFVAGGTARPTAYVEAFYQQELAEHKATHPPSGGGGGYVGVSGGNNDAKLPDVTNPYREKRDEVFSPDTVSSTDGKISHDGYVVMSINGKDTALPAVIGNDERLYLVGERGMYAIQPGRCKNPDKASIKVIATRAHVDRWNGGGQEQTDTQPGESTNTKGYNGIKINPK